MEHFKLSSYKRKKGVLVSPWNEFMTPLKENFQWFKSRLPEYLWIGLILKSYERRIAIDKCLGIVKYLSEIEPSMLVPAWSEIMKMNDTNQKLFFSFLDRNINFDILYPLTCLTKYTNNKVFGISSFLPARNLSRTYLPTKTWRRYRRTGCLREYPTERLSSTYRRTNLPSHVE